MGCLEPVLKPVLEPATTPSGPATTPSGPATYRSQALVAGSGRKAHMEATLAEVANSPRRRRTALNRRRAATWMSQPSLHGCIHSVLRVRTERRLRPIGRRLQGRSQAPGRGRRLQRGLPGISQPRRNATDGNHQSLFDGFHSGFWPRFTLTSAQPRQQLNLQPMQRLNIGIT